VGIEAAGLESGGLESGVMETWRCRGTETDVYACGYEVWRHGSMEVWKRGSIRYKGMEEQSRKASRHAVLHADV
jgi:hypothetical protein